MTQIEMLIDNLEHTKRFVEMLKETHNDEDKDMILSAIDANIVGIMEQWEQLKKQG